MHDLHSDSYIEVNHDTVPTIMCSSPKRTDMVIIPYAATDWTISKSTRYNV
jgi:hypothetical protein